MLVTTKQKMYLTMHGLVDKGETIDIPEDVINDFGKDCFEFIGNEKPTETEPGNETEPGDKNPPDENTEGDNTGNENPPDENTGNEKPKKTNKKKTDTTEE
ncbi:MAG: hypothetical protein ACLS7R_02405 [Veillonella parvula]|jgi:hypothetical protein|uniref:hypothetical protein n=1 Tax=Veillonella parvula TaxID=29466 RepID=UPI0039949CDC